MSWQRVRGHEALIDGFRRVVRRGRLAHAYLFMGPEGVGKRLFATELARALLCEKPRGPLDACDACPACVQIDADSHPDYHFAARPPELSEFPIDLMREVCASFALKPARGRGKVIVIDGVDDFNDESANCFLKTLEEPPPRSLLILIGSDPERQLSTIVSRCQVARFAPLPADLMRTLLAEHGVVDEAVQERLVRLGAGSPGMALALNDPALWTFRATLLEGLTRPTIDSVELARKWTEFVEQAGASAAQRKRAQLVLRLAIDFFDDVLTVAHGGEARRTGSEDDDAVRGLANRLRPEQVLAVLDRCLEADAQVEWRASLVVVLEGLLDALAQKM